ncbi:uncharacterized protein DS421_5g165600 [Arachis hypogaea]|nr:uncharacterized protein DS421_5g165600 [Arachis hypogaea]
MSIGKKKIEVIRKNREAMKKQNASPPKPIQPQLLPLFLTPIITHPQANLTQTQVKPIVAPKSKKEREKRADGKGEKGDGGRCPIRAAVALVAPRRQSPSPHLTTSYVPKPPVPVPSFMPSPPSRHLRSASPFCFLSSPFCCWCRQIRLRKKETLSRRHQAGPPRVRSRAVAAFLVAEEREWLRNVKGGRCRLVARAGTQPTVQSYLRRYCRRQRRRGSGHSCPSAAEKVPAAASSELLAKPQSPETLLLPSSSTAGKAFKLSFPSVEFPETSSSLRVVQIAAAAWG